VGQQHEEQLDHLHRLAGELARQNFQAEVTARDKRPYMRVTNPECSELTERVLCQSVDDGTLCFWWSWQHPIGSVDDVGMAARRIMTVLRSVEKEM
jgi:hypothetical protein